MKQFIIYSVMLLLILGCQPKNVPSWNQQKNHSMDVDDDINSIPDTVLTPEGKIEMIQEPVIKNDADSDLQITEVETKTETTPTTTTSKDNTVVEHGVEKPTIVEAEPEKEKPKITEPSEFVKIANWVIIHEGKKLGTPCNFYLRRVLQKAGFPNSHFVANDFDIYAKNNFKSYRAENFKIDPKHKEADELRRYLWSFPERTPFILQWTRPNFYGHVAIVERIGDKLKTYQASINNYTARVGQTNVEVLLTSSRRAHLTVYSDFVSNSSAK